MLMSKLPEVRYTGRHFWPPSFVKCVASMNTHNIIRAMPTAACHADNV